MVSIGQMLFCYVTLMDLFSQWSRHMLHAMTYTMLHATLHAMLHARLHAVLHAHMLWGMLVVPPASKDRASHVLAHCSAIYIPEVNVLRAA